MLRRVRGRGREVQAPDARVHVAAEEDEDEESRIVKLRSDERGRRSATDDDCGAGGGQAGHTVGGLSMPSVQDKTPRALK